MYIYIQNIYRHVYIELAYSANIYDPQRIAWQVLKAWLPCVIRCNEDADKRPRDWRVCYPMGSHGKIVWKSWEIMGK